MSLFSGLAVAGKEPPQLEKYQHLCIYAELLGINDIEKLTAEAGALPDMTPKALEKLQRLIEVEALRLEISGPERFEIRDLGQLDWYLSKRLTLHCELDAVKTQYEKLLASIKGKQNSLDFLFRSQAEAFIMAEYKRTGNKTMVLPHGTCAIRHEKAVWKVGDEAEMQSWLGELSTEDKIEFEVYPKSWTRNLDALKTQAASGVVVPGLKYEEEGDKISLRLPKEDK